MLPDQEPHAEPLHRAPLPLRPDPWVLRGGVSPSLSPEYRPGGSHTAGEHTPVKWTTDLGGVEPLVIHNHNEFWGLKAVFISFIFCLPESGLKTFFPEAVSDGLTLHIPERSLVLHWLLGASEPLDFPA